ncbi:MAG: type II toxin-antitoxin system HicA family toxin [Acetobacteraceae bacterium]|jgi:hypothetical protein|nr:type II toxin-antitoxin system HicA family toxin [Acetobacteraceae bacterium]
MPVSTDLILNVLADYDIHPGLNDAAEIELPGVGKIEEGETVYSTSIDGILRDSDDAGPLAASLDMADDRVKNWYEQLMRIREGDWDIGDSWLREKQLDKGVPDPPEPHCAWYCPIHFFGHGWGIYVREQCILSHALYVAARVSWSEVSTTDWVRQLLRSAFYEFVLHEFFHHKVESLGLRLLIATGQDRYRPYKSNVYRPTLNTSGCLEESLANAESHRRLDEKRFKDRLDPAIREALRTHLYLSFRAQPPGYAQAINYLDQVKFTRGLYNLQSQVLHATLQPPMWPYHWAVAPNMITSLTDLTEEIYVILPSGSRPIFRPGTIDPGPTASSAELIGALTRYYGYGKVPGGKGSHVKLARPGSPTIILPGNEAVLSPGVVKQALAAIGRYPLARLPDLLGGRLSRA